MKRVFALILALCLFAALLPMTVLADTTEPTTAATEAVEIPEAPESVKVKIYNGVAKDFTLTLNNGDEVYLVAGEENIDLIKWTEAEAPADNFVKFVYSTETGVLSTTFSNLVVDQTQAGGYTCHGIWYQGGEYAVEIELIGTNSMTHGKSACIKNENAGGMTITGEGSMTMTIGSAEVVGSASGALWINGGDLLIKNTTMNFTVYASESAKHHAILSGKGNVTIEGCKITTDTLGGQLVFTGLHTDKNVRYTLDTDPERFVKVKDCEITATANKTIFESFNPVTIENSTLKVTLKGSSGPAFSPAPVFEGDYTAIAGLRKNAEKLDKLKEYSEKKLASYTYIYIVPGIVDLLPTEPTTEATEAPTLPATEPTVPEITEPKVTEATTPATTEATTPATTEATTPATDANDVDDTTSGSPLKIVLIVMIALVVVAAAGIGALVIIRKKKA